MMYFDNRDAKPSTRGEIIFVLVIGLVIFALLCMELLVNYEPKKLSVLLFFVFWIPLLVIHELGHALMAKALGWRVQKIVLGVGKPIFFTRWFYAPVEIRAVPFEGFVQIAPQSTHHARFKHALIYFAGPGVELLLFFIIMRSFGGFEELTTISNDYMSIALQSFAFVALVGAVINLIPQGIITKDGSTPNDGLGIIICLLSKDEDYQEWVEQSREQSERTM